MSRIAGRGRMGGITGAIGRGALGVARRTPAGRAAGVLTLIGGKIFRRLKSGKLVAAHRRGRGITARELRGFRKVTNLLRRVGMHPKGLHRRVAAKR
jgi:hypothetical protein